MKRAILKRLMALWLALSLCVSLSGCDYLNIDQLVSIMGVSIDYTKETGRYQLSVEVAKLSEDTAKPVEPVLLDGEGSTISEALEDMGLKTSGELYFLHSVLFAFGEEAAQSGIEQVLDNIMRSAQAQRAVHVAVVKGGKAADLLKAKPKTKSLISIEVGETITAQSTQYGTTCDTELYRLYNDIPSGLSSLVPAIAVEGAGDAAEAKVDGTAILSQGELCGYLTPDETKYCLLAIGQFNAGFITLRSSDTGEPFTLSVNRVESKSEPRLRDGRLTVDIKIQIKGIVPEIISRQTEQESVSLDRLAQEIRTQVAEKTVQVMNQVIGHCGADLMYLQPMTQNNFRSEWPAVSGRWLEVLRGAETQIDVGVHLFSNGISK